MHVMMACAIRIECVNMIWIPGIYPPEVIIRLSGQGQISPMTATVSWLTQTQQLKPHIVSCNVYVLIPDRDAPHYQQVT